MNKVTRSIVEGLINPNKSRRSSIRRKLESDTPNLTREQAEELVSKLVDMNDEEFGPFSLGELFHADQEIVLSISSGESWTDEDVLVENLLSDNKIEAMIGVRDYTYGGGVYYYEDTLSSNYCERLLNQVNAEVKSLGVKLVMVNPSEWYFTYVGNGQNQSSNTSKKSVDTSHLKKYTHKTVGTTNSTIKKFNPSDYPFLDKEAAERAIILLADELNYGEFNKNGQKEFSLGEVFEKGKHIELMVLPVRINYNNVGPLVNHFLETHRIEVSLVVREEDKAYEYDDYYDESTTDYLDIDSLVAKANQKFNELGMTLIMDTPTKGHFDYDVEYIENRWNNAIKIINTYREIANKYKDKLYEYKDRNSNDHVVLGMFDIINDTLIGSGKTSINNIYEDNYALIRYVILDENKNSGEITKLVDNEYSARFMDNHIKNLSPAEIEAFHDKYVNSKISSKMENEIKRKIPNVELTYKYEATYMLKVH